jgi:hypothetical protein
MSRSKIFLTVVLSFLEYEYHTVCTLELAFGHSRLRTMLVQPAILSKLQVIMKT